MGEDVVKMTLFLKKPIHKKLATVCKVEGDLSYQEYISYAVEYCLKNGIKPPEK